MQGVRVKGCRDEMNVAICRIKGKKIKKKNGVCRVQRGRDKEIIFSFFCALLWFPTRQRLSALNSTSPC